MAIRGQRFHIDLDSDHDLGENAVRESLRTSLPLNNDLVRDITERSTVTAKPPPPPKPNHSGTGFPTHRKRFGLSKFKQQQGSRSLPNAASHQPRPEETSRLSMSFPKQSDTVADTDHDQLPDKLDRKQIDEENRQRLAQMSSSEIEQERAELMAGLSPSLIEMLLKKANLDEGRTDLETEHPTREMCLPASSTGYGSSIARKHTFKTVTFETPDDNTHSPTLNPRSSALVDPDAAPLKPPSDLHPVSSQTPLPPPPSIHFPHPPMTPSLDPADPSFLENLRSKYFPLLPADPSTLAWMAPLPAEDSQADLDSPYNPSRDTLSPSSIRFDFKGRLIPPRLARQISSAKGLHHHGLAPEAAGYTVPELAHLSRSAVAAQRCIAYQTLGRILYRLGRGDFGNEGDELYLGLWKCLEEGRVLDTLIAEASTEDGQGHRSCKVTATEAVWFWRKGGGKRWKAH